MKIAGALILVCASLLLGCPQKQKSAQLPEAVSEESCVDGWLSAHHLDENGQPEGTMTAGGSPLMDERTGKTQSRVDHIYALQPDAKKACGR